MARELKKIKVFGLVFRTEGRFRKSYICNCLLNMNIKLNLWLYHSWKSSTVSILVYLSLVPHVQHSIYFSQVFRLIRDHRCLITKLEYCSFYRPPKVRKIALNSRESNYWTVAGQWDVLTTPPLYHHLHMHEHK